MKTKLIDGLRQV